MIKTIRSGSIIFSLTISLGCFGENPDEKCQETDCVCTNSSDCEAGLVCDSQTEMCKDPCPPGDLGCSCDNGTCLSDQNNQIHCVDGVCVGDGGQCVESFEICRDSNSAESEPCCGNSACLEYQDTGFWSCAPSCAMHSECSTGCCSQSLDGLFCSLTFDCIKCLDTCYWSNDGDCDDGGPGSDYSICELGTDCSDCGSR